VGAYYFIRDRVGTTGVAGSPDDVKEEGR
jgi:hypothetical protein